MEPERTAVTKQRLDKRVPAAKNKRADSRTVGPGVFYAVRVAPSLHLYPHHVFQPRHVLINLKIEAAGLVTAYWTTW
jgi:hypothetical protein